MLCQHVLYTHHARCLRMRIHGATFYTWLSREEVRLAARNPKAAVELMPSVRKTRWAGLFEVPSSRAGVAYTVEVDLKASR
eukprot:2858374-Alexandrium_andersonii.AAC.1